MQVDVKFEENKEVMRQFRNEIINHIDPIMGELKTVREEQRFDAVRQDRQD